jgi:GMP synthase (glutamine-hydrolysing)
VIDPILLVIQLDGSDPLGRLGDWLVQDGLNVDVRDLSAGDAVPADLDAAQGVLVLGRSTSASSDARSAGHAAVQQLFTRAIAQELPALAIGLGSHLLAAATGGRVGANPEGPEYGAQLIAKRANSATDPLFAALPITPDVIQWHVDTVLELPPGAIHLASSPICAVQAYRLGRLAWGIQFHLETDAELLRGWAAADADSLLDYDVDAILTRAEGADDDVTHAWQPFVAAFAQIVMDPSTVPAARPIRVSTADPITDPAEIRAALANEMQSARQLPWPDVHTDQPQR